LQNAASLVFADLTAKCASPGAVASGLAPEEAVAIQSRSLFITANEADLIERQVRSHAMIYELRTSLIRG
jgi:hypothetical protein